MPDSAQSTSTTADFKLRYPDSTKADAVAAARYLIEVSGRLPITVVALPVGGAMPRALTFDPTAPDLDGLRSFIAFQETQPHQVFYVANAASLKCLHVPSNEDIQQIRLVVLDFDPDRDLPLDEERDRLRLVAHDLIVGPVQPRAIIDTGGGMQAVFQLQEPIAATPETIAEIELLMKSLSRSLGADTATCKVKNLFRVPCTWNWPTAAKKKAGREKTISGIWHMGGPRTSLSDLRALATVQAEDAPASAPVEFDGLAEADVVAVLADPSALPASILDLLRDPILQKAIQRPVNTNDTSGDDFYLACTLSRCKLPPHDIALLLSAYGHKVQTAFVQERLFSYIVHTVEKAVARIRVEALLDDFDDEATIEEAEERKKEHRARLKPMTLEEALEGLFDDDHGDLVHGLMRRGEVMVLYGKPGSGKTFVALDLAMHVALGREWNSRAVRPHAVIYIAAESPLGVRYRLQALKTLYGPTDRLFLVPTTLNMFDPRIDLGPLMKEIKTLGVDIGLIVIDTLARTMVGGNENSTQDMSRLISNGDILRDKFGCAVMWVHHTGKNEAAGARGSSALVAATDAEIEVVDYTFRSTKMRDREDIGHRFRLQQVTVGKRPNGDAVTSCTVEWIKGSASVGQNTPEANNLALIIEVLRVEGKMLTFNEITALVDLHPRHKFTVKLNSVRTALNRACESETDKRFTRELTDQKAAKSRNLLYRYGLVNW